jgi:hypothetical protein
MKKISIILFVIPIALYSQENKGLARVKKVMGIECYVNSEPLRDYEIIDNVDRLSTLEQITIGAGLAVDNLGSNNNNNSQKIPLSTAQILLPKLDDAINQIAEKAIKKKKDKKKPIDFDAIIIDTLDKGILIKFTDTE